MLDIAATALGIAVTVLGIAADRRIFGVLRFAMEDVVFYFLKEFFLGFFIQGRLWPYFLGLYSFVYITL